MTCAGAQTTLNGLPCDGITVSEAQKLMNDAFSGIKGACPELQFCGATVESDTMGGKLLSLISPSSMGKRSIRVTFFELVIKRVTFPNEI